MHIVFPVVLSVKKKNESLHKVQLYAPVWVQVEQESSHFKHNLREKSVK